MPSEWVDKYCENCNLLIPVSRHHDRHRHSKRRFCNNECRKGFTAKRLFNDVGDKWCTKCKVYHAVEKFHTVNGVYAIFCKAEFSKTRSKWLSENKTDIHLRNSERRNVLSIKFRQLLITAKVRSAKKNIPYELDIDYIKHLWEIQGGKCFYSGLQMTNINGKGRIFSNVSIDKVVPSIGYTKNNIVLCQDILNRMKLDMLTDDFCELISVIYNYQQKKKEVSLAKAI